MKMTNKWQQNYTEFIGNLNLNIPEYPVIIFTKVPEHIYFYTERLK